MTEEHHVWGVNNARPEHADEITLRARSDAGAKPTVVAIDGPAGSGKSSLAALVAARLDDAPIVHLDDLFPGWDGLAAAPALLSAQVLAPLQRGEFDQVAFRRFDWAADAFADRVSIPKHDFLVIEGCASSVGMARPYAAVRVWVEAEHAERMRRGLARDGDGFGSNWERWARQEEAIFAADDTRAHAHLSYRTD